MVIHLHSSTKWLKFICYTYDRLRQVAELRSALDAAQKEIVYLRRQLEEAKEERERESAAWRARLDAITDQHLVELEETLGKLNEAEERLHATEAAGNADRPWEPMLRGTDEGCARRNTRGLNLTGSTVNNNVCTFPWELLDVMSVLFEWLSDYCLD